MHRRSYQLDNIDDDEILLGTVYKHVFGLVVIYLTASIVVVVSIILAYYLLPTIVEDSGLAYGTASLFTIATVVFTSIIVLIITIIYRQSHIVITDKNITQVIQSGLFQRKISQLTMANVEDVTSEQKGFFASVFNFGILKIETAGEQANFHFNYCPRPSYYAKVILEAREQFISQDYPYAAAVRGHIPKHK